MNQEKSIELISRICQLSKHFLTQEEFNSEDIREILQSDKPGKFKTKLLFKELMKALSLQGIGDEIVNSYRRAHGDITYFQISNRLNKQRKRHRLFCSRLRSFKRFKGCGYRKGKFTCNNPTMLMRCPVRRHDLLKGVLNVKAYAFFFYIRDICQGDLISHFNRIIKKYIETSNPDPSAIIDARNDLVADFKQIFGVGDKLANMTLSFLLLADQDNKSYARVGQTMIAIDSLVHNFLHRTGILKFYDCQHNYGPGCSKNCVPVIDSLSKMIDARQFNEAHPEYFPRFIQFSIWRFCTISGENICNGININDAKPCKQKNCPVYLLCDHVILKPIGG